MAAMTKVLLIALVLAGLLASPVLAKGTFKGTYGGKKFRSKKIAAGCSYTREIGGFSMVGGKGNRKNQVGAGVAGTTPADPTAPGAVFPMVLTNHSATFFNGPPPTPPQWLAFGDAITVTLTGYKKGKLIGTVTGTLDPLPGNPAGPIQVNATFSGKCSVF